MGAWYILSDTELILSLFVKTRARKTAIVGADETHLHISLHAKPEKGEANSELIRLLSEYFHLSKRQILLRRGQQSRYKQVVCKLQSDQRTTKEELMELLNQTLESTRLQDPHHP